LEFVLEGFFGFSMLRVARISSEIHYARSCDGKIAVRRVDVVTDGSDGRERRLRIVVAAI